MSFDYEEVANILQTEMWNASEDGSMRNFHTDIYLGPDIIERLLEKGYFITSIETKNGVSDHETRVWISTFEEVHERWDVQISTGVGPVTEEVEEEAEELVEEMETYEEKPGVTYRCNDCGNNFRVENVIEYEGCPECRSRDTDRT